eukprot:SAG31_NODE_3792_length_3877_cov_1.489412_1_plen_85_part_00
MESNLGHLEITSVEVHCTTVWNEPISLHNQYSGMTSKTMCNDPNNDGLAHRLLLLLLMLLLLLLLVLQCPFALPARWLRVLHWA